jgi:hypothetical protein
MPRSKCPDNVQLDEMILKYNSVYEVKPTGDAEFDKREALRYCYYGPLINIVFTAY